MSNKSLRIEIIFVQVVVTSAAGEFWRLLGPGRHTLRASHGGLMSDEVEVEIAQDWAAGPGPRIGSCNYIDGWQG